MPCATTTTTTTTMARAMPATRRKTRRTAATTTRAEKDSGVPALSSSSSSAIDRRQALRALALGAFACVTGGVGTPSPSFAASSGPADELLELRKMEEAKSRERLEALYRELREEESKAIELRYLKEGEAQAEFMKLREEGESKSREQVLAGKTLCVTPFGIDVVGITEFVALAGAVASGISANQKKEEITQLNEKLRGINTTLRQQARGGRGTMDEPGGGGAEDAAEAKTAVATSSDEWEALSDDMKELRLALREGRKLLRDGKATDALAAFKKSLMLARVVGDLISVRRATRGLGAAKRQLGDRKGAIADLLEVLDVSQRLSDYTGDMDALGAIADLYTELGDLENAGRYYDLYLNQINDETVDAGEID